MKIIKKGFNWFLILFFIVIGVIGLAIPIMPQALFFAIALILISFEVPQVEEFIEKRLSKENPIGKFYFATKDKFEKYFK